MGVGGRTPTSADRKEGNLCYRFVPPHAVPHNHQQGEKVVSYFRWVPGLAANSLTKGKEGKSAWEMSVRVRRETGLEGSFGSPRPRVREYTYSQQPSLAGNTGELGWNSVLTSQPRMQGCSSSEPPPERPQRRRHKGQNQVGSAGDQVNPCWSPGVIHVSVRPSPRVTR